MTADNLVYPACQMYNVSMVETLFSQLTLYPLWPDVGRTLWRIDPLSAPVGRRCEAANAKIIAGADFNGRDFNADGGCAHFFPLSGIRAPT